jgi:aconitase B
MREELASRILDLANRMADPDKVKAKMAKVAMERLVHVNARPGVNKNDRQSVNEGLLTVAKETRNHSRMTRAHAIRLLGYIGGGSEERALGSLEKDPELGEDARMARERIRRK